MTPALFLRLAVDPALSLLPGSARTDEARAFLIAIALQETLLRKRRQAADGPAHSYFQFELGTVELIWKHATTTKAAREICRTLDIAETPLGVFVAMEFHDILACYYARLLLLTVPRELPARRDVEEGWSQYVWTWRPGAVAKSQESAARAQMRWPSNYQDAWYAVKS